MVLQRCSVSVGYYGPKVGYNSEEGDFGQDSWDGLSEHLGIGKREARNWKRGVFYAMYLHSCSSQNWKMEVFGGPKFSLPT